MIKESGDTSKKEVSTTSTPQFQCLMLKPSNYSLWAIRMQIILEANGLWEMIEPLETTQADNKKDKTAIAFLYQALSEEQLLQITKHKTAKAIWDALKTRHIGEERVQQARLQTLKSDFEMLHMKEDETIDTFTEKLTTLVNKAASLWHTIKDQTLVRKLLNVVPDRIKANEQFNLVEEDLEPTLLMAILKDSDEGNQVKKVEEQKVSLHEVDVGYKKTNMDSLWYLDNGASNHMTGEDETIDTFTRKLTTLLNKAASLGHTIEDQTLVRKLLNVVPDRYSQIVASIEQYSDLREMTMEEVIGRLKTYEEIIKYKKGKQADNQEKLMFTRHESKGKYFRGRGRGKRKFSQGKSHEKFKEERKDGESSHRNFNRNNLKKSSYDTSKLQCYQCKKIGHIAPNYPQRTKANEQFNLVEEDLELTLLMAILENSDEGNQIKKVEEQKVLLHEEDVRYKETNMDSLWYLDNGASNHMTGVREHFKELDEKVSGKTITQDICGVYFLSTKDQAFDTFKEYKKTIENELRTTLKMLRTDRGGEFIPNEFTQYCKENVTNMPQNFWAEAVRHAIYILNSVPTKALEDITPYEAIKQRKPNLEKLRVFGCIAYAKVPSQRLTKLDDRSSRMVYLGNEQGSKAYRLFDPTTQKICVSRVVKFKENET
nr:zinc finger, CCHC-type [Tanacetum cinerariifolium]